MLLIILIVGGNPHWTWLLDNSALQNICICKLRTDTCEVFNLTANKLRQTFHFTAFVFNQSKDSKKQFEHFILQCSQSLTNSQWWQYYRINDVLQTQAMRQTYDQQRSAQHYTTHVTAVKTRIRMHTAAVLSICCHTRAWPRPTVCAETSVLETWRAENLMLCLVFSDTSDWPLDVHESIGPFCMEERIKNRDIDGI